MARLKAVSMYDGAAYNQFINDLAMQKSNDLLESINRLKKLELKAEPELRVEIARTIAILYGQILRSML